MSGTIVEATGIASAFPRSATTRSIEMAMQKAILEGQTAVDKDGKPNPDTPEQLKRRIDAARQLEKSRFFKTDYKPDPNFDPKVDPGPKGNPDPKADPAPVEAANPGEIVP